MCLFYHCDPLRAWLDEGRERDGSGHDGVFVERGRKIGKEPLAIDNC